MRVLSKLVIVLTIGVLCGCTSAVELVKDGKAAAVIVVGEKASTTEKFAAEDLQLHLEKMSGAKVPIVIEGAQNKKATEIVIGTPKTNQYIAKSGLISTTLFTAANAEANSWSV